MGRYRVNTLTLVSWISTAVIAAGLAVGPAAASFDASPGIAIEVNRVWMETDRRGRTNGHATVTVTNNARRPVSAMNVNCFTMLDGAPVKSGSGQVFDMPRGESRFAEVEVRDTGHFDSMRCQAGAVVWG